MSALAKLAEKIVSNNNDVSVTFTYKEGVFTTINVNRANSMILQKHEVNTELFFKIHMKYKNRSIVFISFFACTDFHKICINLDFVWKCNVETIKNEKFN